VARRVPADVLPAKGGAIRVATPCRLDYLLTRGLTVAASGMVTLAGGERSASDHRLVWADVSVT
jgi:endonuclease/exonuclease/phosphatase family metal-dependent hydrolase